MKITASFALTLALALASTFAPARAADYTGDVTDVRVVRRFEQHPGSSLVWEPYIAQWKDKQLVVAYGAGIPGKVDMGDIYASVSTDDGDTWGEPVVVFDHNQRHGTLQFAYANAILFHPPGQDILWCFGIRCPMNYPHSEDAQMVAAYSADGGRSWNPVELMMSFTEPLIVVAGIQTVVENGIPHYLIPAHRNTLRSEPMGRRDQFVLTSTSLLEWKLANFIPQPVTGPKVFLHEGGIAEGDAPGELKMVMRTAQYEEERKILDPPRAFSSVSKDGGRTWSPAKQEPDLWNARSKGFYGLSANGAHVYVYNDGPAYPEGRMALRYKIQSKLGGPWSAEKTFYETGFHNTYPTLIEIAPGDFRAVWDGGTKDRMRTHILFGKFKVTPTP